MKKNYNKIVNPYWRKTFGVFYEHRFCPYYRHMQTYQERRENGFADGFDEDIAYYKVKLRRSRIKNIPDPWCDFPASRSYTRSWKIATKNRKQWMK